MFKRFLSYYKPYLKTFILDMTCALGNSAIGIVYPIITRYMLNDLIPNRKSELIVRFGILLFGCITRRQDIRKAHAVTICHSTRLLGFTMLFSLSDVQKV